MLTKTKAYGAEASNPGHLVKISPSGYAAYVECFPDGSLRERSVYEWNKVWSGQWRRSGGNLIIAVGGYELHVPAGSARGKELNTQQPWAGPTDFYVFPAVAKNQMAASAQHLGVIKFTPWDTHAARYLPDGSVQEFRLLSGSDADSWGGTWSITEGRLSIGVGEYQWREELTDGNGYFLGVERDAAGVETRFPAVSVVLDPKDTASPLGAASAGLPLFEANGYEFYSVVGDPKGYFASVLEARKSAGIGGVQRLAAKCVRAGQEAFNVALREIELAQAFSATDGLIAAFEYFQLPDDPGRYGEFAGGVVQILELGETDLQRHIQQQGPMKPADSLNLAKDMASALSALHTKFRYVHSDARLANIIGKKTGDVLSWRLADFNVTSKMATDSTRASLVGTTGICMSPALDQRIRDGVGWTDASDDVWAVGVVLAQCDSGTVLPQGQPVSVEQALLLAEHATPLLRPLIQGCLNPDPARRWTAAKARAEALKSLERAVTEADTELFQEEAPQRIIMHPGEA